MAYRNKTFVSFDGDNDMHYYRLLTAWHQNDNTPFDLYDAHVLTQARDSSTEASIKQSLMERFRNSKIFMLLIGENTRFLYKFVKWEIEQAITRELPIIAVNLNGRRSMDVQRCPPVLQTALAMHVTFNPAIIQYAMENWPDFEAQQRRLFKTGPFYYNDQTYARLGL